MKRFGLILLSFILLISLIQFIIILPVYFTIMLPPFMFLDDLVMTGAMFAWAYTIYYLAKLVKEHW